MTTLKFIKLFLLFALLNLFTFSISYAQNPSLETVYEDNEYQFVSVAVSKSGRMFVVYPYWSEKHKYSVVEVFADGSVKPFPDETWNSWNYGGDGKSKWVCAQAVYIDDADNLWIVDPASPFMKGVVESANKVMKYNLKTNMIERVYDCSGFTSTKSYINDIRIDNDEQYGYLTNSNEGGIVVLNLQTGEGKEVLKGHRSVMSDTSYQFVVEGKQLTDSNGVVRINSDGIELSSDGTWLYFKPLTDDHLYRVETSYLRGNNQSDITSNVHYLGRISTTDGMIKDKNDNLYLGDIEKFTLYRYNPATGSKTAIITSNPQLSWPDTYSVTDDGWMYLTVSHIHLQPKYNNGADLRKSPYAVFRFRLPDSK
jgi:sugar lactone lactonase YvrE